MTFSETSLPGCYTIKTRPHLDLRGTFVKTYLQSGFREQGLESKFAETFYTVSEENVLRGMHLQLPPADAVKLVSCAMGSIIDVLFDLRRGSPTYGRFAAFELSADLSVYIQRGVAHGFYVTRGPAMVVYQSTAEHAPKLDSGIAWDSIGFPWPNQDPIISDRDARLPSFNEFDSPFHYLQHEGQLIYGR